MPSLGMYPQQVEVDPFNSDQIIVALGLWHMKRYKVSTNSELYNYNRYCSWHVGNDKREELLSFTYSKSAQNHIFVLCHFFEANDQRKRLYAYYNTLGSGVNEKVVLGADDNILSEIKHVVEGSTEYLISFGSGCVVRHKVAYNPFSLSEETKACHGEAEWEMSFGGASVVKGSPQSAIINRKGRVMRYIPSTNTLKAYDSRFGQFGSCLPSVTSDGMIYCGGSSVFRIYKDESKNRLFNVHARNDMKGALFRGSDNALYIQQNLGTRVKLDELGCVSGELSELAYPMVESCDVTHCERCNVAARAPCLGCRAGTTQVGSGASLTCQCPGGRQDGLLRCFENFEVSGTEVVKEEVTGSASGPSGLSFAVSMSLSQASGVKISAGILKSLSNNKGEKKDNSYLSGSASVRDGDNTLKILVGEAFLKDNGCPLTLELDPSHPLENPNSPNSPVYYTSTTTLTIQCSSEVLNTISAPPDTSNNLSPDFQKIAEKRKIGTKSTTAIATQSLGSSFSLLTLTAGLIVSAPNANYLTFLAQTYNKLILYTLMNVALTESVKDRLLEIFRDLFDDLSLELIEKASGGSVGAEMEKVCEHRSRRLCETSTPNNFLLGNALNLVNFGISVLALLVVSACRRYSKRVDRLCNDIVYSSIPSFLVSNQLQIVFGLVNNLRSVESFSSFLSIFGYIISIISLLGAIVIGIGALTFKNRFKSLKKYFDSILENCLSEGFKGDQKASIILKYNLIFDLALSLALATLQKQPTLQTLFLAIFEAFNFTIYLYLAPIKGKLMSLRTTISNFLFILISLAGLALSFGDENSPSSALSWVLLAFSLIALGIDLLMGAGCLISEVVEWFRRKRGQGKDKGKVKVDVIGKVVSAQEEADLGSLALKEISQNAKNRKIGSLFKNSEYEKINKKRLGGDLWNANKGERGLGEENGGGRINKKSNFEQKIKLGKLSNKGRNRLQMRVKKANMSKRRIAHSDNTLGKGQKGLNSSGSGAWLKESNQEVFGPTSSSRNALDPSNANLVQDGGQSSLNSLRPEHRAGGGGKAYRVENQAKSSLLEFMHAERGGNRGESINAGQLRITKCKKTNFNSKKNVEENRFFEVEDVESMVNG